MFDYTICPWADRALFKKQCKAIENNIPDLQAEELLEDVDGSLIQTYRHKRGEITVRNSETIGALYVESEFDLLPYFERK